MKPDARILLDSVSPDGYRLTTMELTFHRFVLAEFNTHRSHSRNSASSRAIPVEKQLAKVNEFPAWPLEWASEQSGMQGGTELTGDDLQDAQDLFEDVHEYTVRAVSTYLNFHPDKSTRLHKSLVNRLLEPFMWHTVIASATEAGWRNFFKLRSAHSTQLAQPEIRVPATIAHDLYDLSVPKLINYGEWHTPLIQPDDDFSIYEDPDLARIQVSVARCARVSFLTHEGVRDMLEDMGLYTRLSTADPAHDSPLEHVATPSFGGLPTAGNFDGWSQYRHFNRG